MIERCRQFIELVRITPPRMKKSKFAVKREAVPAIKFFTAPEFAARRR